MADFVLKNNFFECNVEVKWQKCGTAIGTKFAFPYACICMDELETEFLKSQHLQPSHWIRYIDCITKLNYHLCRPVSKYNFFTIHLNYYIYFFTFLFITYKKNVKPNKNRKKIWRIIRGKSKTRKDKSKNRESWNNRKN